MTRHAARERTSICRHGRSVARRGFTLIELIIAIGLFSLVMTLASGAYLLMIGLNRQVQGVATGIDNLSFAMEEMTRTIRTGTAYLCDGTTNCSAKDNFSLTDSSGASVTYSLSGGALVKTKNGVASNLTDSATVTVTSLSFDGEGIERAPADYTQARVKIVISGTVTAGPHKTESFTVETLAAMRGTDIHP